VFPKDFVLVIDTREQNPLCGNVKGLTVYRDTLKDGDYSIRGFENRFAVERKKVSDFYSYIGKQHKQTVEKLKRFKQIDFSGLVIEASLDDLLSPQMYTQVSPETARQFLVSVNVRYGIHVFCDRHRKNIEMWLLDRAIKFYIMNRGV
jgi:ERCC4-type nuclease